ncbi:hypothetical protein PF007_g11635 [Phytophthora fragariae]|uniref:Uncharacterized protein n=1 Tax=Phytophthora fragariae TaxID=53985 RepID=A0A6A3S8D0_9STRA|nr:hypothetical protein PF007_g11635 [Phytophthora fragariae]
MLLFSGCPKLQDVISILRRLPVKHKSFAKEELHERDDILVLGLFCFIAASAELPIRGSWAYHENLVSFSW